ncbi:MAG: hypothetical protein GQ534_06065 [Candidatus Delongbacteria bacterium]|nr:hypothetical protein [Candidatus Delongbacteria bacterium]
MDLGKIYNIRITDEELIKITGEEVFDTKDIPSCSDNILRPSSLSNTDKLVNSYKQKKYTFASNIIFFITVVLSGILAFVGILFFTEENLNNPAYSISFVFSIVLPMIVYLFFKRYVINIFFAQNQKKIIEIKKLKPTILGCLLDQVDRYNIAANKIITAKKLLDAGNKINVTNLEQTANVYFNIRKDLIRALKTERVLRDNPDYRTSKNLKNPDPIKDIQIQDIEYEELTNEAIRINNEIEQQLKILAVGMSN